MKKILVLLIIACQLISCHSKKDEVTKVSSKNTDNIIEEIDNVGEIREYEGILPCADCSGIETVLKIYQGDGTVESHRFELSSLYKGKSQEIIEDDGNYNLERGLADDPDGTIYVLNWDKPEDEQIYYGYLSETPDKIYLLDNKRQIIKSKLNNTLILKK
ncbi:copper resistance protein NlpE N-terminal domain-containing protein [Flavobacterium sp.]|uniref:copper resistance protein NlpE N-terminal domain-containing protein n=1 Tax=Flavobacterium sp. TaxID=239 RepID=UPI00374D5BEC